MSWLAVAAPEPDEYKVFTSTHDARRAIITCTKLEEIFIVFIERARWKPETKVALKAMDRARCRAVGLRARLGGTIYAIEASNIDLLRRATLWYASLKPDDPACALVLERVTARLADSPWALRPGDAL